jgi:hypothetical protein
MTTPTDDLLMPPEWKGAIEWTSGIYEYKLVARLFGTGTGNVLGTMHLFVFAETIVESYWEEVGTIDSRNPLNMCLQLRSAMKENGDLIISSPWFFPTVETKLDFLKNAKALINKYKA